LDINAIEIVVCLIEYHLSMKRPIMPGEEAWFNATYVLDYTLSGSQWEDLVNYYSKLCEEVKRQNYFR